MLFVDLVNLENILLLAYTRWKRTILKTWMAMVLKTCLHQKAAKKKFLQYMGVSNDDDMVVARRSSVSMFSDRILPCVCTNPSTATILKQGDRLLMLGHTDPQRRNPKQLLRSISKQRLQFYEANENTDIEIQNFDAIESNLGKSSNKYVANQPRIRLGIL